MTTATAHTGPSSPLTALRRHWWLAAVLPAALAVLGFLYGAKGATTYTGEARVSVGAGDLTSAAIAGFPQASQQLADNYARWVNNRGVDGTGGIPEGVEVSASPIPESNVVRVEAKGTDKQAVVDAAQKAATDLVKAVNSKKKDNDPNVTLAALNKAGAEWGAAKAAADSADAAAGRAVGSKATSGTVASTRRAAADAHSKEAVARVKLDALGQKYQQQISQGSTAANLVLVSPASLTQSDKAARQQRDALLGLAVGLALALLLAVLLDRVLAGRRRAAARPRPARGPVTHDDILSAPVEHDGATRRGRDA